MIVRVLQPLLKGIPANNRPSGFIRCGTLSGPKPVLQKIIQLERTPPDDCVGHMLAPRGEKPFCQDSVLSIEGFFFVAAVVEQVSSVKRPDEKLSVTKYLHHCRPFYSPRPQTVLNHSLCRGSHSAAKRRGGEVRLCLRFAHRCVFAKKKVCSCQCRSLKVEPSVSVRGETTRRWSQSADLRAELEEGAKKHKLLQTRCRLLFDAFGKLVECVFSFRGAPPGDKRRE